ncbi:MAG: tetratricopeptide repeat protein [Saprospiraceae bacterium]|nr:tetratricopeptide repeat protein [Saprospiraceae bacterium]
MNKIEHRTFCFTDIKGSTRLAVQLGTEYTELLSTYRAIVRSATNAFYGIVVDNPGDGFLLTFRDPLNAAMAVSMMQQEFARTSWPQGAEVLVRMGIHDGKTIVSGDTFTGLTIHKAARISDAARGGQVLLSHAAKDRLQNHLPPELKIRRLGKYQLKDFDQAESLYQLVIPGVENNFPPPRALSAVPVVAVLPFKDLAGNPDNAYFEEGISLDIIHALSRHPGIRVVASSSSFALAGPGDVREKGIKLNAEAVLEGAFRRMDERIRIDVELIEIESGVAIWSEAFAGELREIHRFQDDIAQNIADTLEETATHYPVRSIKRTQTRNVEAYDYYLRGKKLSDQFSKTGVQFALKMYEQAVDEDPDYALAYTGIADAYSYLYMYETKSQEYLDAAIEASRKATELDPDLAEAHVSRGLIYSLCKQFESAEREFEQAIQLNPKLFDAYFLYARVAFAEGKIEKAAGLYREAHRVRPEDFQSLLLSGQCFEDLGFHERAEEVRREGVRIAAERLDLNPGDTRALYMGANGLVALGRKEEGLEWLQRALILEPTDSMLLYNAGCIYAMLGMKEEALNSLERAEEHGLKQIEWYHNDNNLDSIRTEPRFLQLLQRINGPLTTA